MPLGMRASAVLGTVRGGRWVPYWEPAADPLHRLAVENEERVTQVELGFWTLAVVFDALDFVTTVLGIGHPALGEGVPLSRWVLAQYGVPGLFVEHVAALVVLFWLWYALPRPYRLIVPGQFAVVGALIVAANAARLAAHGVIAFP